MIKYVSQNKAFLLQPQLCLQMQVLDFPYYIHSRITICKIMTYAKSKHT